MELLVFSSYIIQVKTLGSELGMFAGKSFEIIYLYNIRQKI